MYGVPETTLRRHIIKPCVRTWDEYVEDTQALTVAEENVLKSRLLFLDDFIVPADRALFYELAYAILRRRDPTRVLGRDWIH